jgi:hypothetical protein
MAGSRRADRTLRSMPFDSPAATLTAMEDKRVLVTPAPDFEDDGPTRKTESPQAMPPPDELVDDEEPTEKTPPPPTP